MPEGAAELTTPWYEDLIEGPLEEVFREAMVSWIEGAMSAEKEEVLKTIDSRP